MRIPTTRFSRKRSPQGWSLTLLGLVLFSFLWMGCEDDTSTTYTVTFNTNGGTAVPSQTVKKNALAKNPADPTRKGFTFENWYSDAGFKQVYNFKKKITANITLYAKWTAVTYTLTFDSKGGTDVPSQTVRQDSLATRPADPTRVGFTFENWYSDTNFAQVHDFTKPVTTNITLYATWTPKIYMATFNSRGGTAISSQTVEHDSKVSRPTDPTRAGFTFENWYSDASFTQAYDFTKRVTANITLYAKWMLKTYMVTFDSRGGTAIPFQTVKHDSMAMKPADPKRDAFTFLDWYSDASFLHPYDFEQGVTANIMLYAKWEIKLPTYFDIAAAGDATEWGTSATLQFSITNVRPTGANKEVIWSVEGGAGNGTIDANGLYTAPETIPSPETVTIKATSAVATNVTQTYNLLILATIPDDNFRAKLKAKIPAAFSGDLLRTSHAGVTGLTDLNVKSSSIANLEGIQYFIALIALDCSGNNITRLDLSKNIALTRLTCDRNRLTTLDLSQNLDLEGLFCNDNQLTGLDISKNTALRGLVCGNNPLTVLDVSKNIALTSLTCFKNGLTVLDVSQNTVLKYLYCQENELKALDVSKNTALLFLFCNKNSLKVLDVSQNTALTDLDCSGNSLTVLDVSKNVVLTRLTCMNNKLTSLDIRGMREAKKLDIVAEDGHGNPIDTLKVHDNIKQSNGLKAVKTKRDSALTIEVYTADAGSTAYTKSCANYDPNTIGGLGNCETRP